MAESMSVPAHSRAQRTRALVFAASALGEIGVGVVLLPYPQLAALLLDAPLDRIGLLVARGLGAAALALGLTWWIMRDDARAVARCAAGFIIYNIAVGALFAFQATQAADPALPWLVGVVHLLAGGTFAAAGAIPRWPGSRHSSGRGGNRDSRHGTDRIAR